MQYRTLGETGLHVSVLGLGMAALGRPGYINLWHGQDLGYNYEVEHMERHAHAVLDAARSGGVTYIDTARSYGRAEEFVRSWLDGRGLSEGDVTVGSKWGYTYTADWRVNADRHEVKSHTLPVLMRQWDNSRARLGNFLKLYQIHSATLESGVLENADVLRELGRIKGEGVAIGLTLSGARQAETLERAVAIEIDGRRLFDAVQATWNLLETSTDGALAAAHGAGLGIIVKEVLANGRLTDRNTSPVFAEKRRLLAAQARRLRITIDALATAAALAQPWSDVVLSGASSPEQLLSNAAALDVVWDDEASGALSGIAESPQQYWRTRSELPWN